VLAACSQRPETLSIARCDKPLRYRCALPLSGGLNRQEWNLGVELAAYVATSDGHLFVGKEPGALSDHAALSVDITLKEP